MRRKGRCPQWAPAASALSKPQCSRVCRYVRFGYFVDAVEVFDALAFMLPALEAAAMDPQTRICLEQTQASAAPSVQ